MKLDIVHGDLVMFNDVIKDAGMSLTQDQTEVQSTYESLLSAHNKLEAARKGLDPDIAVTLTCSVCMCIAVNPVVPICPVDRACRCASVMCHDCAVPWIERKNACPTCRTRVVTVSPNVSLQHLMNRLRMCCWKCNAKCMTLEELTEHMRGHEEDEKTTITCRILRRVCELRSEDMQKLQKKIDEMELSHASKLVTLAALQKQLSEERTRTKELKKHLRQHAQHLLAATNDGGADLSPFNLKDGEAAPSLLSSVSMDDDPIEDWASPPSPRRSRSPHRNSQAQRMRHVPVGIRRRIFRIPISRDNSS